MGKVSIGSKTAKAGFANERAVAEKFNNWKVDKDAQQWLVIMGYKLDKIEYVLAVVVSGHKADLNVQVQIKLKKVVDTENIQVKLVSSKSGFNQVDKRWLKSYHDLWNFPDNVYKTLQYFTGEIKPYKTTRDARRMFFDEMTPERQKALLDWFTRNKTLILSDIIRGRGVLSAEWVLVVQRLSLANVRWVLKNINSALQHYSDGDVRFSPHGSLYIGKVSMQRKGGDSGAATANMLQFKLDPIELFNS